MCEHCAVMTRPPTRHHGAERHRGGRSAWLRAGVLGANDGLISTASLMVGVAGASSGRTAILVAGIAGLTAGALSMAAGEFVSVSSQRDTEQADLQREREELEAFPQAEFAELCRIYENRGLSPELARQVAVELSQADQAGLLLVHARDELGIDPERLADPIQASFVSALSFLFGALVPILGVITRTCGSAIRSRARRTFLVETNTNSTGDATPGGRNADVEGSSK